MGVLGVPARKMRPIAGGRTRTNPFNREDFPVPDTSPADSRARLRKVEPVPAPRVLVLVDRTATATPEQRIVALQQRRSSSPQETTQARQLATRKGWTSPRKLKSHLTSYLESVALQSPSW
jgi:hypothetical protein